MGICNEYMVFLLSVDRKIKPFVFDEYKRLFINATKNIFR
jgi:hypothetical protein